MTKEIQLTQGMVALVEDDDYEYLAQFKWCAQRSRNTFYAMRHSPCLNGISTTIKMHSEIMDTPKGMQVDHRNGNGLDNRRKENLRVCTGSQNQHNRRKNSNNTSGYKGVYWYKQRGKWRARIEFNGKEISLGYYTDAVQAARAYDEAARKHHGEFANLNFPQ